MFAYLLHFLILFICDDTCVHVLMPVFYPFFPLILSTKMITAVPVIEVHCFVISEVGLVSLKTCCFLMFAPLNIQNNLMGIFPLNFSSWTNFRFSVFMPFMFLFWYQSFLFIFIFKLNSTQLRCNPNYFESSTWFFLCYLALSRPCPHLPFILTHLLLQFGRCATVKIWQSDQVGVQSLEILEELFLKKDWNKRVLLVPELQSLIKPRNVWSQLMGTVST